LSDSSLSKLIRDLGRKTERRETRFDSAGGPARIRVRIEHFDRAHKKEDSRSPAGYEGHFHIDCSLEAELPLSHVKKPLPNAKAEVQELLGMFAAETSGKVCSEGRFLVPRKLLPKSGVADALLDVSASIEKAQLAVTGVSFDIQKYPPYERLHWRLRPPTTAAKELHVAIDTFGDLEEIGGSLEKISQILWKGVHDLVLEIASKSGA
jgi:hypothetical protein